MTLLLLLFRLLGCDTKAVVPIMWLQQGSYQRYRAASMGSVVYGKACLPRPPCRCLVGAVDRVGQHLQIWIRSVGLLSSSSHS